MLHRLRESGEYAIGALLTTVNEAAHRVAMHAVRVQSATRLAKGAGAVPRRGRARPSSYCRARYQHGVIDGYAKIYNPDPQTIVEAAVLFWNCSRPRF